MKTRGLSQETLKLIACLTMLIDHVGYLFVPGYKLRAIGRLAFPIFCFLIAEGAHHTRDPKRYALRMALSALISEPLFDLTFYRGWTWGHQNVMITLLLGFAAVQLARQCQRAWGKWLAVIPFALAAELLNTDYGGAGVFLIALFALNRQHPRRFWLYFLGMVFLFDWMPSVNVRILGNLYLSLQMFGLLSLPLIYGYSGKKATSSRWVQWGFYLFYPAHMALLYLIWRL